MTKEEKGIHLTADQINSFLEKRKKDADKCPYCDNTEWFQDIYRQVRHCWKCRHWWLNE